MKSIVGRRAACVRHAATVHVVRADLKRLVQLNIVKDLLGRLYHAGRDERLMRPDPQIVFAYDFSDLENGQLAT